MFTVALINHCCSLSWKVCLRASTSRSGQRGISLLMSIFWWTSQGPWEMTSLQSREFHKILVGGLPHTGGISTHWACVTVWWFSVTVYLHSGTSLMRSLWIRDTTLIRTLSAVPTTKSCVQIYLWIRDTSLYRTASWVPKAFTVERLYCMWNC